ncbi:MAG: GTP-binding protein [Bacteroidetes bacterium]|nr:GTP-binding protein [Bacteroidota bacterium]
MSSSLIPLYIFTGFLGVGKTSAILHALRLTPPGQKTAVVVNEFGDISIDGPTISSEGLPFAVADVPGGCICCAGMEMLTEQLSWLLREKKPDRILIEPSGIARPSDLLIKIRSSDLSSKFDYRPVIGIFDPELVADDSMRDSLLFDDQAGMADLIFLNRTDLSSSDSIEFSLNWFRDHYPDRPEPVSGVHGQFPSDWLEKTFASTYPVKHQSGHHPESQVKGLGWYWNQAIFDEQSLSEVFESLLAHRQTNGLIRAKGIFLTPGGPVLFEIAGKTMHRRASDYRVENRVELLFSAPSIADEASLKDQFDSCIRHV